MSIIKTILLSLLVLFTLVGFGQSNEKIFELRSALKVATKQEKPHILNEIAVFYKKKSPDSSRMYAHEALDAASNVKDYVNEATAYFNIGTSYYYQQDFNKVIEYYTKALEISKKTNNKALIAKYTRFVGLGYQRNVDYDKAIIYYLDALELFEDLNDKNGLATTNNNIGIIFMSLKNFDKATEYFEKALSENEQLDNKYGISDALNNISRIGYKQLSDIEDEDSIREIINKSIEYGERALEISQELNNTIEVANGNNLLGALYMKNQQYEKAKSYFYKSLEVNKAFNNKTTLLQAYGNLGMVNDSLKNYEKSIEYYLKAIDISIEIDDKKQMSSSYIAVANVYRKVGKYKEAFDFMKKHSELEDDLEEEAMYMQIERMDTEYETKKKEEANERLRYIIIGCVFVILLIIGLAFWLFKLYRQIRRNNAQLEILYKELEHQKNEITDSIIYAKRIQKAILPTTEFMQNILKNYFVLFRPRDIVSGDFFWTSQKEDKIIACAVDCTGHGVPGAFMSMLGTSFLNEIVNDQNITKPSEILDNLRDKVIMSLKQTGREGEAKDGMDIALVTLDRKSLTCEFAGANNPLYIVRNNEIIETKGSKMPIGIQLSLKGMKPFENNVIELQPGDNLYLFSDGYADQLGGPKYKKFLSKRFKKTLLEVQSRSMPIQKEILKQTLIEWQGDYDQLDDIVVMGISV